MNEQDTIQEIKERLVRIETLLEKNAENWEEKIKVANHRIADLEDTIRWIARTAIGGVITGLIGIVFALIKWKKESKMNIDFKKRLTNKTWWASIIGALILLSQQLGLDLSQYIPQNYVDIINTVFLILTLLGITVDTSTDGISDNK